MKNVYVFAILLLLTINVDLKGVPTQVVQAAPSKVAQVVQAAPSKVAQVVQAAPSKVAQTVQAAPSKVAQTVQAAPSKVAQTVQASSSKVAQSVSQSGLIDSNYGEKLAQIASDIKTHQAKKATKRASMSAEHLQNIENLKTSHKQSIIDNSVWKKTQVATSTATQSNLKGSSKTNLIQSVISSTDSPASFFVGYTYQTNANLIPLSATTNILSWSGSYWPILNGIASVRYTHDSKDSMGIWSNAAGGYTTLYTWYQSITHYYQPSEHNQFYGTTTFQAYVNNYYSPSEKYDFLFGDYAYTLTNALKNVGYSYEDSNGNVAGWMGICHGWTPASFKFAKPVNAVTVTASDGVTQVQFLPDDIKALTSLFWANAKYNTDFIGTPCSTCQNVNPASLIITFANHIGFQGENLIFDPSDDDEIWNQPIRSYEITWYNLITQASYTTAAGAKESVAACLSSSSSFAQTAATYAASGATNLVGASIKLTYVFEIQNTHTTTDTQADNLVTKTFLASIDLDANDNMIGGSWEYDLHPNFIWQPDMNSLPQGVSDAYVTANWCSAASCLKSFTSYAVAASQNRQVLKSFVDWIAPYSA